MLITIPLTFVKVKSRGDDNPVAIPRLFVPAAPQCRESLIIMVRTGLSLANRFKSSVCCCVHTDRV